MSFICPTVLADNAHTYREQMERIQPFAKRVQIDLVDGDFAQTKTVLLDEVWWPEEVIADLHLMYRQPGDHLVQLHQLQPDLVIVHAEAEGNFVEFARALRAVDIKAGVALLPETNVDVLKPALEYIDHVLIFSGKLGYFGGKADLVLLDKVADIRRLLPDVEIGWDGGINEHNAAKLASGGVDILNVGGFIQKADDPAAAYKQLHKLI